MGEKSRIHWHEKTDEVFYVLSGTGSVNVGNEGCTIRAGDCIEVPRGKKHRLANLGSAHKEPLRVLAICNPPYSDEDTYYIDETEPA